MTRGQHVPEAGRPVPLRGIGLLAGLVLAWGLQWPMMKVALNELGPWTFRAVSLLIGGATLLLLVGLTGHSLRIPRREWRPVLLVGVFATTGYQLISAYGISFMAPGRAVILAFTMPLWASIIGAVLLKERLTRPHVAGLALGLGGMSLLIGPDLARVGEAPTGSLLILAGAVSLAMGSVLSKYFRWSAPIAVVTGWQVTLGSLPIVAGSFVFERAIGDLAQASEAALWATAYNAFIGTTFGLYAWFRALQICPVRVAALGTLAIPVIGVFTSALIVGDPVTWRELVALALVVSALALAMVAPGASSSARSRRAERSTNLPD